MHQIFKVRPVDGGDDANAEVLRELHELTFLDSAPMPDFCEDTWWVAYAGWKPAAFVGVTPSTYLPNTGYLKRVAVVPEFRGHGLQIRLHRVCDRYARRVGWDAMFTDTATFNVASSNNLFKSGYELFRPEVIWNGEDFLYWRKRYA